MSTISLMVYKMNSSINNKKVELIIDNGLSSSYFVLFHLANEFDLL
jgi:hypothetical protein